MVAQLQMRFVHREKVIAPEIIGTHINQYNGAKTRTNKAMIIYSKTGCHIYPRKDEN